MVDGSFTSPGGSPARRDATAVVGRLQWGRASVVDATRYPESVTKREQREVAEILRRLLEATGMRVGELETLRWGDVDEDAGRWRVARQNEKAGRGRWVNVPPDVFRLVLDLVPREDRTPDALVFAGVTQARLRTDMARTARAAGIALYSPHDLRHRRISLWHMQGVPLAQVGAWVGQRNLSVTADTYTHVLVDGEISRESLLPAVNPKPG